MESASHSGRLLVMLSSQVRRIHPDAVEIEERGGGTVRLPNDDVIVCAGGELPTALLRQAGVQIEMHRGTARGGEGLRASA